MDSDTTSKISSFANKEGIKLEMLDMYVELYGQAGITLDKEAKDFVMTSLDIMLDEYDIGTQVPVFVLDIEDGDKGKYFTPVETVDKVYDIFRTKMAKMIFQLMSHELASFLNEREGK